MYFSSARPCRISLYAGREAAGAISFRVLRGHAVPDPGQGRRAG